MGPPKSVGITFSSEAEQSAEALPNFKQTLPAKDSQKRQGARKGAGPESALRRMTGN